MYPIAVSTALLSWGLLEFPKVRDRLLLLRASHAARQIFAGRLHSLWAILHNYRQVCLLD